MPLAAREPAELSAACESSPIHVRQTECYTKQREVSRWKYLTKKKKKLQGDFLVLVFFFNTLGRVSQFSVGRFVFSPFIVHITNHRKKNIQKDY